MKWKRLISNSDEISRVSEHFFLIVAQPILNGNFFKKDYHKINNHKQMNLQELRIELIQSIIQKDPTKYGYLGV